MRCPCASHRAEADRRYLRRIDSRWPRWLAFVVSMPGSKNAAEARESLAKYDHAVTENRIGVGILGSVICEDSDTAQSITLSFGLRIGEE